LENPLEKHRKLGRWTIRVFFRQFEHGLLNDIKRKVFIPKGKHRLLECSALDFGKEIREFLIRGQLDAFFYVPTPLWRGGAM
jgi:hypothetical protein